MWQAIKTLAALGMLCALLILNLLGCTTTPAQPVKPTISDSLRTACEPLPGLKAKPGEDMRGALLQNRAESVLVHDACASMHRGVLRAVGVDLIDAKPVDRWAEFEQQLKGMK